MKYKFLNFGEFNLIIFSSFHGSVSFFFFGSVSYIRNLCLTQGVRFFNVFFLSFIVFALPFKSVISLRLICVWHEV